MTPHPFVEPAFEPDDDHDRCWRCGSWFAIADGHECRESDDLAAARGILIGCAAGFVLILAACVIVALLAGWQP